MTWFGVVFVCLMGLSTVLSIHSVGRPREPLTPGAAVAILIINGLLTWGAITVGTVQP